GTANILALNMLWEMVTVPVSFPHRDISWLTVSHRVVSNATGVYGVSCFADTILPNYRYSVNPSIKCTYFYTIYSFYLYFLHIMHIQTSFCGKHSTFIETYTPERSTFYRPSSRRIT